MAKHFITQMFNAANRMAIDRFIARYPIGKQEGAWTVEHIARDSEHPANPQTGEAQVNIIVTLDDGQPEVVKHLRVPEQAGKS